MKVRERLVLLLVVVLFASSLGMFYYQNFYKPSLVEQAMVEVLVAMDDIERNMIIDEKNTEWYKVDESIVTPYNVLKEDEMMGEIASQKIFRGEFISKKRIMTEEDKKFDYDTYAIEIEPDYTTNLNNGDLVRLYVQVVDKDDDKNETITNLLVFDKKEIIDVKGIDGEKPSLIKVNVTDKEALSYYNAKHLGTVIALKYEAEMDRRDFNIPKIQVER